MKTQMKIKLLVAVMLLPLMSLYAQPNGQNRQHAQQSRERTVIPDLTDEQKDQMQEIRLSTQKSLLPIKNELGENRAKLRTLTTADNPDMKAIDKLIDENGQLMASMMKIQASNHQKVRSLLTEDQRIVFDSKKRGFDRSGRRGSYGATGRGQRSRGPGRTPEK